jgi:hypothetical protein
MAPKRQRNASVSDEEHPKADTSSSKKGHKRNFSDYFASKAAPGKRLLATPNKSAKTSRKKARDEANREFKKTRRMSSDEGAADQPISRGSKVSIFCIHYFPIF